MGKSRKKKKKKKLERATDDRVVAGANRSGAGLKQDDLPWPHCLCLSDETLPGEGKCPTEEIHL